MINFKPIDLDVLDLIQPYVDNPNKRSMSSNNLAYIFTWSEMLHPSYAIIDNTAILSFEEFGNSSQLICSLHNYQDSDLIKIITDLIEYADSVNKRLVVASLTQDDVLIFNRLIPNRYREVVAPQTWDYIYNRSDLELLTGSKYQPKRNHINKFKSMYDYRFEPLDLALKEQYIELCNKTHKPQDIKDNYYISLEDVVSAIETAIDNFERLNLIGGALYVGGKLVAFTYGAKLTDNMFDIMIEKANIEYNGVYSMINNLFVKSLPQEYIYINREEDLGVEGLRKAKLSYHPCKIQENHRLIIEK